MYARTTTLRGNPEAMDEGIAFVRDEVMPLVRGMDGHVGLSMLCDRDSGRCIVTSAWQSEDALRASAEAVRDSRTRAGEIFGDTSPEIRDWEIALMHRGHETHNGARVRVIWSDVDPGRMQDMVDEFRMTMMPRVEELPGFCSLNMMVDRQANRCALAVCYDSAEDMRRADERAAALRQEANDQMGMHITEVAEFDLALAHLRVPEMA